MRHASQTTQAMASPNIRPATSARGRPGEGPTVPTSEWPGLSCRNRPKPRTDAHASCQITAPARDFKGKPALAVFILDVFRQIRCLGHKSPL